MNFYLALPFVFLVPPCTASADSLLERSHIFDVSIGEVVVTDFPVLVDSDLSRMPQPPEEAALAANMLFRDSLDEFEALLRMPAAIVPYEEGLESVFYPDDREEVTETETYPASATVLITSSNLGRCTGWVVAERTLVTAGHCVHEGGAGGSWAEDVRVYAGRNGSVSPFGSCAVSHMFSVEGWVVERDKNYDYGVLIADCELVSVTGAFGLADPDQEWLESAIEVTGYPVDKPLTQWAAEDKVTLVYELKLFHRADTMSGMSGSAVHIGDLFVFAVHTNARHNGAPWRSNNAATRLTEARLSNIAHWIDFEGND